MNVTRQELVGQAHLSGYERQIQLLAILAEGFTYGECLHLKTRHRLTAFTAVSKLLVVNLLQLKYLAVHHMVDCGGISAPLEYFRV